MDAKPSKTRVTAIDHKYLDVADWLTRWKRYWGGACCGLALGGFLVMRLGFSEQWNRSLSTGPISAAHQPFESRCHDCHVSGSPVREGTVCGVWVDRPGEPWSRPADQKCAHCHPATYTQSEITLDDQRFPVFPAARHSKHEKNEDVAACSTCHLEHEGAVRGQLRATRNENCTTCHSDLVAHTDEATSPNPAGSTSAPNISSFDDHPRFRSITADAASVKFSHARHMSGGLKLPGERDSMSMKVDAKLNQFGYGEIGKPVQLSCENCHAPDNNARYYSMPDFATSCKSCHTMNILGTGKAVNHPLSLADAPSYQADVREEITEALEATSSSVPVSQAVQLVSDRCVQCHELTQQRTKIEIPSVKPVVWKRVWLRNSVFDHLAHANIENWDCTKCHPGAGRPTDDAMTSTSATDVLIPNHENCVKCHTEGQSTTAPKGPTECFRCHHYHSAGNRYVLHADFPSIVDTLRHPSSSDGGDR